MTRALVLLSGGLDSTLAARILQEQGLEVEAATFRTPFTCCQDQAAPVARELGIPLTVIVDDDDYFDLLRRPEFGFGRGANPCVDCRIYMFRKAKTLADRIGAEIIASGEVVGQRPMSQKRRDLDRIAHRSGLADRLLRPLSAKLLPPTRAERAGLVDRERLHGFSGRGRQGLIALARALGITHIPGPSSGCALTNPEFGAKVFQLLEDRPNGSRWDFELLKVGRHFRLAGGERLVLGRREAENEQLGRLFRRDDAPSGWLLEPRGATGPTGLLVAGEAELPAAAEMLLRYMKHVSPDAQVVAHGRGGETWACAAATIALRMPSQASPT